MKPDEGERGWQVEKISDSHSLQEYLKEALPELLLQEFIGLPEEYGVMYYRLPSEKKGHISSLMKREFLSVTGDGQSTLLSLMEKSERCIYQLPRLKQKFKNELIHILPHGEKMLLESIGNHNRGTTFLDAGDLISEKLTDAFDQTTSTLKEWYFGRLDVRTPSFSAMENGDFKVLEINGANSEPAHIYDPHMGLLRAYKDLFRHWNVIYKISRQNKLRGFRADSFWNMYSRIQKHLKQKKEHPNRNR
jgi:hypothetical protein